MYDIAVIGAGPAGSTLARLIGGRQRVLLVDVRELSADPPDRQDKCCGGLIAPDAQKMLGRFGLGLPASVLVEPQLFVVRAVDLQTGLQRHYQRHYINVDRGRFDRWLVSLVPPPVDRRFGWRFRGAAEDGDGWKLRLRRGGEEIVERTRVLVGADGAGSSVRRLLAGPAPATRTYIAVQEWYESPGVPPYFCAVFDTRVTDFYAWIVPKGDAVILGAALTPDRRAAGRFCALKARLTEMGFAFGRRIAAEAAPLLRPTGPRSFHLGRGTVALVGEAAGFISPSSAEGISYAFRSAAAAGEALAAGPEHLPRRYHAATCRLRLDLAAKVVKGGIMHNRLLRAAVMAAGIGSVRGVGRRVPLGAAVALSATVPGEFPGGEG